MLLFDLGNTRIKLARGERGRLHEVVAWAFDDPACWVQVEQFIAAAPARLPAWAASVTRRERVEQLQRQLESHGHGFELVGPAQSDDLLRLAYAQPASFGIDRWLALRAVRCEQKAAFVLASVGTALTVDAVDAGGRHLGGVIAPSPERAREALFERAPHLRGLGGRVDPFATCTADAVQSGAVLAAVALIERLHSEAEHRLDDHVELYLTGGGAEPLLALLHAPAQRREHLVLHGLLDLAERRSGLGVVSLARTPGG